MRWIAALVLLIGCGYDSSETPTTPPANVLAGTTWGVGDGICADVLVFYLDGTSYEDILICNLTDGTQGAQNVFGTYAMTDSTLTLYASATSCPSNQIQAVLTLSYVINGSTMTVGTAAGFSSYEEVHQTGPGQGTVVNGCYDVARNFQPMAIHPL